jgi:neutral ceramidase
VCGEVRRGALAWALLAALAFAPVRPAVAAPLKAGAATGAFSIPDGTPLAGYGSVRRRLLLPDVLGRHPHAFWFKPHAGELDPVAARALVLETPSARLAWVTVDLIAVDRAFTQAVERRLEGGIGPTTVLVSASHTHSGPGAFVESRLMGWVALDSLDAAVRGALVETVVATIERAAAAAVEARVAATSVTVLGVTKSRLAKALDPELVALKITSASGAPIALVWNFAIHGTVLGARNLRLSGDVMGLASRELERGLGIPVLFVNGAVGDVSPAAHGEGALARLAPELARAARAAWDRAGPRESPGLAIRRARVALPPPRLSVRNCAGRWVPASVAVPLGRALPPDAELTAVALGSTAWVTMPGELQAALGLEIKREARALFKHAFVAGVSNDYLGYFVTAEDYGRPGYVTCATVYGPRAGECLATTAIELLRGLSGQSRPVTPQARACDEASDR